MKPLKCVAFLNVLNLVSTVKNRNLLKDETEVFKKINSSLTTNRSENYETFWDSVDDSFAKINLTLNIDPNSDLLADYLNLCTLVQKVTWGNKVFIKRISPEESEDLSGFYDRTDEGNYILLVDDTPEVSGVKGDSCSNFPFDNKNIISRVLSKLVLHGHNFIVLTKKAVPLGSGLGGGTCDAAVVINRLLGTRSFNLAKIGSDLPFMSSECETACVFGIGDRMLELYKSLYPGWVYLLIPFETVGTESVFKKARDLLSARKISKCDINQIIRDTVKKAENFKTLVPHNDLEKCVTNPKVRKLSKILKGNFKKSRFGMSGSGCSFFLFAERDSEVTSLRDLYSDPLVIVKTKFKWQTQSHEFVYL